MTGPDRWTTGLARLGVFVGDQGLEEVVFGVIVRPGQGSVPALGLVLAEHQGFNPLHLLMVEDLVAPTHEHVVPAAGAPPQVLLLADEPGFGPVGSVVDG